MRKENSSFNMKYKSRAGTPLHNNDYFSSVEDEKFACYVVADGLGDGIAEDPGARVAVEAVLAAFNEKQSISFRAVNRYITAAHKALRDNPDGLRMRVSLTVVVTNYQKIRVGHVGNTRFNLYRGSKLFFESRDQSLSWEMMEEGELQKDRIAQHEERHNLYNYLGQNKKLDPEISKKIKLKNGDVLSLFTRGIWENCHTNDIIFALHEAEKDPEQAVIGLERLILDARQKPDYIDNYTMCFVFVDKVYLDANKRKRLQLLLKIAIPVLIVLVIVIILLVIYFNNRAANRANMEAAYLNAIEYIQDENFVRAKEEIDTAHTLATELKDSAWQIKTSDYQKLIEAVILGDDSMASADFETAQGAYLNARERSRFTDNLGIKYIERKLELASNHISVHDYINLGDAAADAGNYESAEELYLSARRLAAGIYYAGGKQEAVSALETLYQKMEEQAAEYAQGAQAEITATDYVIAGDQAYVEGDLVSAAMYYQMAMEKYTELGNEEMAAGVEEKIKLLGRKELENEEKLAAAASYVEQGDRYLKLKEYTEAKRQYILAREIYSSLNDESSLSSVKSKIEIAETYITGAEAA